MAQKRFMQIHAITILTKLRYIIEEVQFLSQRNGTSLFWES